MAFKTVAVAWLSGGALLLGYAGYAWLRGGRALNRAKNADRFAPDLTHEDVEPLSDRLERVPEELALGSDSEGELPANSNALGHRTELGALFLARATGALSPFHFPSQSPADATPVPR